MPILRWLRKLPPIWDNRGKCVCRAVQQRRNSSHAGRSARGAHAFLIQPTCNPVNDSLMELLIMADACRRASARNITAVLPYYGYARQDRKTRGREPITAKLIANLLITSGVTRVVTMDLHAGQIQGFFDIPVDHLPGVPILAEYFAAKHLEDLVVVSGSWRCDSGSSTGGPLARRYRNP